MRSKARLLPGNAEPQLGKSSSHRVPSNHLCPHPKAHFGGLLGDNQNQPVVIQVRTGINLGLYRGG